MTDREVALRKRVKELVAQGLYPSSRRIFPDRASENMSGQELRWRTKVLLEMGWRQGPQHGGKPRWWKPDA